MLLNDIPYLEPLLMWLRNDEILKDHFTEKSFFMPHKDLLASTSEAIEKDCPAPRALWIIPGESISLNQKPGCRSISTHTFNISIFVQCIRSSFELVKRNDEVRLGGQYMELAHLRMLVKDSVHRFMIDHEKKSGRRLFSDLVWIKDQSLFPDEDAFLVTALEFQIKIYP